MITIFIINNFVEIISNVESLLQIKFRITVRENFFVGLDYVLNLWNNFFHEY